MKINKVNLSNFRNWPEASFEFEDRVLIYGQNALGKTNILEAAYILATTRSFRGRDAEVVSKNKEFMRVWGEIENDKKSETEVIFQKSPTGVVKEFKINDKKHSSIDFVGEFSAIVFSPEDINLISGSPEAKRRYLSFTIGQKDRSYLFHLLNYKKVLKHRNELLKRADLGTIKEEIDVWDQTLAENGQKVLETRHTLSNFITEKINYYYQLLSGENRDFIFVYQPELWGENILTSLQNARERYFRKNNNCRTTPG